MYNHKAYKDAKEIISRSIGAVLPEEGVRELLAGRTFSGRLVIVAAGKAAWQMAHAASEVLRGRYEKGIVITKYGHVQGELPGFVCREAGHPTPDDNSFRAAEEALLLVQGLGKEDTVLFLLSGGGSALFEKPLCPGEELRDITKQLLGCGADIVEINTIRKRLSAVKGGRFAMACAPARVFSVVLSDIVGDPVDMIASGPACPDASTCREALEIAEKYRLRMTDRTRELLSLETPKELSNVETHITGSVKKLCLAAERICRELGYEPRIVNDALSCEAKEAGAMLARLLRERAEARAACRRPEAWIFGGETVVTLKDAGGLGGRNQELALTAAKEMDGLENVLIFSVGSDGTDGPTDAAGGIVDGSTAKRLREKGISPEEVLQRHDSYHALAAVDGLIMTGPTGTNVNDLSVGLVW